jgi:hypothetical protein
MCNFVAVVFDSVSGDVLFERSFDTYGNANATIEYTEFLNAIPSGRIVSIAAKDAAHLALNEAAYQVTTFHHLSINTLHPTRQPKYLEAARFDRWHTETVGR